MVTKPKPKPKPKVPVPPAPAATAAKPATGGVLGTPPAANATTAPKPATTAATTAAKPRTAATTAAKPGGVLGTPAPVDPALAADIAYKAKPQDVANMANRITAQDSAIMRQAATQGRRAANRQGMLSSSMAIGAAQDAVIGKAAEMATATAAHNAAQNLAHQNYGYDRSLQNASTMATRIENRKQRVHEAAESLKTRTWQSGENVAERTWKSGESEKERTWESGENLAQRTWQSGENLADRTFEQKMQDDRLSHEDRVQIRDIAFRKGQGAADRALEERLAEMGYADKAAERTWQSGENELTREAQKEVSDAEIASRETIAGWGLDADDKKAAGSLASTYSTTYEQAIQTILGNKDLTPEQRKTQMKNARARYDANIDGIQDLFDVDLAFDTPPTTTPTTGGGGGGDEDEDEDEDEDKPKKTPDLLSKYF